MTKLSDINIGIIGATGAVGVEALKLLEKINHPKNKISLFASERSTGTGSFQASSGRLSR